MLFRSSIVVFALLAFLGVLSHGRSLHQDSQAAASGDDHHGRVQIKVYRGPDDHDHEHHAPWGYWVKQPADDDH